MVQEFKDKPFNFRVTFFLAPRKDATIDLYKGETLERRVVRKKLLKQKKNGWIKRSTQKDNLPSTGKMERGEWKDISQGLWYWMNVLQTTSIGDRSDLAAGTMICFAAQTEKTFNETINRAMKR